VRRHELEHILRAAAAITDENDFILVGSQAVLGQYPDAPKELLISNEVDIYPEHKPELADLIDGAIGAGSMFSEQFGYHADGVGPETAVLPRHWRSRAFVVTGPGTRGACGFCPEANDLAISKLAAGREKDSEWFRVAAARNLLSRKTILSRLGCVPLDQEHIDLLRQRLEYWWPSSDGEQSI
jgi:hypothetical protein